MQLQYTGILAESIDELCTTGHNANITTLIKTNIIRSLKKTE
jgi:hypothetical protein